MGELVDRDQEHLRLLQIGFYIMAGLAGFISLFSLVYIALGGVFVAGILDSVATSGNAPPRAFGWIFVGLGLFFLFIGLTVTFLTFLAGRSLQERCRRTFCLVMAGLCCLQIPWGTAIGICAINVQTRPSVRTLFEQHAPPPPPLSA